jgi:hypothetical protein
MALPRYLALYKDALTVLRVLPPSHQGHFRRKMAFNFREIFDVIRGAPAETSEKFMDRMTKDIDFLKQVFALQPELLKDLIPVFESDPIHSKTTTSPNPPE